MIVSASLIAYADWKTGNQVKILDDPVTVIGSPDTESHWICRRRQIYSAENCESEKAYQCVELESGNLPA